MKPNKQQIRQAVDEAGYLFEQQVGYKLREHRYLVTPNYNFEDLETGDSREIDLYAILGIVKEELDVDIWQLLLIECKKTKYPLVFFSKPKYEDLKVFEDYFDIVGAPESLLAGERRGVVSLEKYLKLNELSHRYKLRDTASQFCMIIRKGKDWEAKHEHVYNGMIVPLIKCLSFERKEYRESLPREMIQLRIIYPIIVVHSELYLMNSETNQLSRKKWILFYRHYDSKNIKLTAMIDFVRHKHLDEYLGKIESSFNSVTQRVINKRKILLQKIKSKKFYMED
jgi:hypothetical protein